MGFNNPYSISGILQVVTCTVLIILNLKFGRKKIHFLWALFNLSVAIFGLGCFFVGQATSEKAALFWLRVEQVGTIFIPVLLLHVVLEFCEIKRKAILLSSYAFGFFYLLIMKSHFVVTAEYIPALNFYFVRSANIFYPVFFFIWMLITGYSFILLYTSMRTADLQKKNQIKYFMLGMAVGFFGGATNFLLPFKIDLYPYGNFLIPVYCGIVTYAILRHQLLDIEVVIKKTLVFAGLLASVFTILVLPTLLIQEYIFRTASDGTKLLGMTLSGILIILSLRRIENFLMNITDKYLFQKKYDYKELLKTFTTEVLTVVNLERLVNLTVDKLSDIVKINSCAVLLLDSEKQRFDTVASRNVKDPQMFLSRPDGIVTFLEQTHGYLLKKDLIERKVYIPGTIQEIIDKLNTELIIPMVLHNEVMGILTMGKKKSDDDYSQDDLDILLPLARTLAIAVSNAKLFDELGKTQAEAAQKEKMAVIGTLSAGINHEICNPLGIARGQCEAFLLNIKDGLYNDKSPDELLVKAKDIMGKVIKETDRATAITKRLSGFAKPAKGQAEIINIDKEIDDVLGLLGYELKLEKIEFEKRIEKNLSDILVDKKQLQEILFNLIRNAGQAIGEKGKITVIARENGGKVFIDIKDTGSGVPEDKLKELFNPFFTTKEPGKGTGLGLFIVRQIVEKNGGRIYLKETKVGEGTTFTIEFPVASKQGARA